MRLDLKHRQPHPPANRFRDFRRPKVEIDAQIHALAVECGLLRDSAEAQVTSIPAKPSQRLK